MLVVGCGTLFVALNLQHISGVRPIYIPGPSQARPWPSKNKTGELAWWHRGSIEEGLPIRIPHPAIPQELSLLPPQSQWPAVDEEGLEEGASEGQLEGLAAEAEGHDASTSQLEGEPDTSLRPSE